MQKVSEGVARFLLKFRFDLNLIDLFDSSSGTETSFITLKKKTTLVRIVWTEILLRNNAGFLIFFSSILIYEVDQKKKKANEK